MKDSTKKIYAGRDTQHAMANILHEYVVSNIKDGFYTGQVDMLIMYQKLCENLNNNHNSY